MLIFEIVEPDNVAELQPDMVVTVYHGTDMNHALDFCINGIDARQRFHRLYPHWDQGEYVSRGIFVTTDIGTALSFGNVVLQFKTLGKNLHFQYPSPASQRTANQSMKPDYPNSFRPGVSWSLLARTTEPQALFRGLASPRDVEMVYLVNYDDAGNYTRGRNREYASSLPPDQFIERYRSKTSYVPELVVDTQQINLTPDQLIQAVQKKHPSADADLIENLIREAIDPVRHKTYQDQIRGLMNFSGGSVLSYSVAKRLLPKFLERYGLAMAPNRYERLKKGPHFG